MSEPIRILQVVTHMNRGGLETMLMNYYRHIDREKVQFDFLTHRDVEADYDKEIKQLGGTIYHLPVLNPFSKEYLNELDQFFRTHDYKIVHSHLDCLSGYILRAAKKAGCSVRIAHAHNTFQEKNLKYVIKAMSKPMMPKYATNLFACGEEAGKWMFSGHKFTIMHNAIDVAAYTYDAEKRAKIREEMQLDDAFVVGHVGRFNEQKNHGFLIELFAELVKLEPKAKLVLVGIGDMQEQIKEKVKQLQLEEKVVFAGLREDVNEVLQAVDVFVFPSLFEGLPVTMVEAQAAGLPCFISDKVPIECKMTDLVEVISLNTSVKKWAEQILKAKGMERVSQEKEISKAGYDIVTNAAWLQEFYLEKIKAL